MSSPVSASPVPDVFALLLLSKLKRSVFTLSVLARWTRTARYRLVWSFIQNSVAGVAPPDRFAVKSACCAHSHSPGAITPSTVAVPNPGRHAVEWNVTTLFGRTPDSVGTVPRPIPLAASRFGFGRPSTHAFTRPTPSGPVTTQDAFMCDTHGAPETLTLPLPPVTA